MATILGAALAVAGASAVAPIATATPTASITTALLTGHPAGDGHYLAEIRRTKYGIPHILADDYGSLGYGYGYAFAQDNLCVLADRVLTIRGERSEYFGPSAESDDPMAPATNLDSDIYYQSIRESGIVPRLLAQPAPLGPTSQARQLVNGYVDGYNRYLADTGVAHLPDPTCRGKAWVTPITALDIWNAVYDLNQENGITKLKDAIATATPPTATSSVVPSTVIAPLASVLPSTRSSNVGSNAWALGRDATTDHDSMLLANPHAPWQGYIRIYQVQLTIPGVLNVSGGSLYGTPVVELGYTQGLAFSLTASIAQRDTLYQLTLVPGDPTSYLVDGHAVPMTRNTVTVTVPGGHTTRTLYSSRYGPVLATGWTATTALAVDGVNVTNLRSINEWLAMDQADNLAQLRTAQDTYQGLPFINTLATDTSGTTYIADASVVPHVTDAQAARCIDTSQGKAAYPQQFILDGSTSACDWGSDPDAIQPGIFGPSHGPSLTRTDYVANSNNSLHLANPNAPLTGYPTIFGPAGAPPGMRPRLSLAMIADWLAGTDGYGPPGFTLTNLQTTALGERDYSTELGHDDTVAMCRAHPILAASDGAPVNVTHACTTLAAWNARADLDSRGAVLWREFFSYLDGHGGQNTWSVIPYDAARPLTTPSGINGNLPVVQIAFADAVQFFQTNHIPLDITLASAQCYAGIPLPGCTDMEGCFALGPNGAVANSTYLGANGTYNDTTVGNGSTFMMAVELTPRGPQARTILTYSESANPNSPHHTDQTELFAHRQWVNDRFTQTQIAADTTLQTTVLRS